MLHLITYDLKNKDKNYEALYEQIKQCGSYWWHYLDSVWIIQSDKTISECHNLIKSQMDDNDRLFIVEITNQKYQGWLPSTAWEWLKDHNR